MDPSSPLALPHLLEILSKAPNSTFKVDDLSSMVFASLQKEGCQDGDPQAGFNYALQIGADLGIINVKNDMVKMAFRFPTLVAPKKSSPQLLKSKQSDVKAKAKSQAQAQAQVEKKNSALGKIKSRVIQKRKVPRVPLMSSKLKMSADMLGSSSQYILPGSDMFKVGGRKQHKPIRNRVEVPIKRRYPFQLPIGPIESRDYFRQKPSNGLMTPVFFPDYPDVAEPWDGYCECEQRENVQRKSRRHHGAELRNDRSMGIVRNQRYY